MKKKITILGHQNPDVDSIISGVLLSEYLTFKGHDCSYVIPDTSVDEESAEIVSLFGIDCKKYQNNIPDGSDLILVDHHETTFDGKVLAVIDHHPTLKEFDYPVYINKKSSSTSKLIYDIVKGENETFLTKEFIRRVLVAMLVDTCSFKSSKTNPSDIPWTQDICKKLDLDFEELKKIGYCLTNLDNIHKASIHGFKQFKYDNKVVKTSYIQRDSFNQDKISQIVNILQEKVISEEIFMWMFLVTDIEAEKSLEYRIYSDKVELFKHDFIASRGSNIMPEIERIIKNDK